MLSNSNGFKLVESKGENIPPQEIAVDIRTGVDDVSIYRYDMDQEDFLPFFNGQDGSPKRLKGFCDYVMLVNSNGILYVILIEMKRGRAHEAEDQIAAGRLFMDYVTAMAERIKTVNQYDDFDSHKIQYRRIILYKPASNKMTTRPEYIRGMARDSVMRISIPTKFRPAWVI